MKNIFKALTILILILGTGQLNAQIDTIDFTLSSEKINTSGQDVIVSSTVEKSGNTLIWNQQTDNGVNANTFTIISNSGNWNQELSTGTITYNMVIDQYDCELVLTGQENRLSALLTIGVSGADPREVIIHIDNITYQ